jgi:asparagine synthase (glutamine-hydrolysing)
MCTAMGHRGPDAAGTLVRPQHGLGLGHVRLSIIDVAGGDQPIGNEDGTVWTIFNGEIYNYKELRGQLEAAGHRFRTSTDTEVLVHLYEEKGERLVDDLLGDFALAIWDDRRGELLLARDRLGVKPLYYADYQGRFAFASTLPALLEGSNAPRVIDPLAIQSYLTFYTVQAPLTIYRHMHKLLPGHLLTVRNRQVRIRRYWDFEFEPDHARGVDSFAEELDGLIHDAVRRQMVADVPLGAFLSGGVDSSTVVSTMARYSSGPVKTFSIGFREAAYDESRYYKPLVRALGVEHHELVFEPNLLDDVTHVVQMFGEPCAIASAFPLYYLAKLARQHVTVALSGDGPDEIFAGYERRYSYFRTMDRARRLVPRPLLRALERAAQVTSLVKTTNGLGNTLRRGRKFFETTVLPPEQWLPFLTINRTALTEPAALMACQPAAGETLPYVDAFLSRAGGGDWMQPFLYADIKVMLPDEMFTKLDAMTMANGLEGRVPLCDHRIVELAARIPSQLKFDGRIGKAVMRRAVQKRLPQAIMERPKVGFNVPLNEWFRDELYPMAHDLLTDASFAASGLFEPAAAQAMLEQHRSGHQNYGGVIWSLVAFELWRRSEPVAQGAVLPTKTERPPEGPALVTAA